METLESLKMMLFSRNIPCYIFWKDTNLVYQGGNKDFLNAVGFTSISQIIGKTDYDLPWAADAETYRASDVLVLEGKSILNSKEMRWHVKGPHPVIVNKVPLKDENNQVVGILGIHQDINFSHLESADNTAFNSSLLSMGENAIGESETFNSPMLPLANEAELFDTLKSISNLSLTHREIECLSLWLSGHSIKESSYCLNLSQKSIEAYRKTIKEKAGVYHKYQLIDLMQAKGTFHLLLSLGKLIQNKANRHSVA